MGADEFASAIICKGAYFAMLIGNGVVIVWHAETCEEARRLNHGEWISVVECSRTSSLLATAETNTVRIWDISTCEELYSIQKSTARRILSLSFGAQDEELLVGYDDASIRCIELLTLEMRSICILTSFLSALTITTSFGYRGKPVYAWNLDAQDRGPQICTHPEDKIGKDHDSSTRKVGTPESVVWCPGHPTVLILYNDASLFEWKIGDKKQRQISGISARVMAICLDGNLLPTSDHNGTVSVWTVPEFRLTHQLHETDMVRGLAFSQDGQRFYDIRGPLCNVWEPDDLYREELSSTAHETTFSEPGAQKLQLSRMIPRTAFFCCGKDSGAIVMYEMETGQKVRKVYGHNAVASVWLNHPSKPELLLCVNSEGVHILKWESLAEVRVTPLGAIGKLSEPGPQVPRDNNNDDIDPLGVRIHHLTLDRAPSRQGRMSVLAIRRAVPLNATQKVLEAFPNTGFARTYILRREIFLADISTTSELYDISHLKSSNSQLQRIDGQASLSPLPTNNDCHINRLVGCFQGHIVFLDQNYCFCTWDITPTARGASDLGPGPGQFSSLGNLSLERADPLDTGLKKHFYLPKDWLSPSMLRLCVINDYGTILCRGMGGCGGKGRREALINLYIWTWNSELRAI
ncbi:WD40-repeat-containing domain protein [Rhypophila sp. PSN 637]